MTALLEEGVTYDNIVTVTNTSQKLGVPTEAVLNLRVSAVIDGATFEESTGDETFGAGEVRQFTRSMSIPSGSGGQSGEVMAEVRDPAGNVLASGSMDFTVEQAEPIVFTAAGVIPFNVQSSSGWWGVSYFIVTNIQVAWDADHRVPLVPGEANCSIDVVLSIPEAGINASMTTTPPNFDGTFYYFPAGAGGLQTQIGLYPTSPPPVGELAFTMQLTARVGGTVVGQGTFEGVTQNLGQI